MALEYLQKKFVEFATCAKSVHLLYPIRAEMMRCIVAASHLDSDWAGRIQPACERHVGQRGWPHATGNESLVRWRARGPRNQVRWWRLQQKNDPSKRKTSIQCRINVGINPTLDWCLVFAGTDKVRWFLTRQQTLFQMIFFLWQTTMSIKWRAFTLQATRDGRKGCQGPSACPSLPDHPQWLTSDGTDEKWALVLMLARHKWTEGCHSPGNRQLIASQGWPDC